MKAIQLFELMLIKNTRLKKITTILVHLFIWLIIFSLPLLFRPDHRGMRGPGQGLPVFIPFPILMNNIYLVLIFYINLLILMPHLFSSRRWGWYIAASLALMAGSLFVHPFSVQVEHFFFGDIFRPEIPKHGPFDKFRPRGENGGFEFRQFSFLYIFIMTWAISMTLYLFKQLQESLRKADQVLASALQSELSFLKAQINPHFLFNTLNNIYVLTLKKSDKAPTAVMQLSNLMRKITDDTTVDFVPFAEEEQFIRDYLELQELRKTEKTTVEYAVEGDFSGLSIAPRLLIPFIDNAFKYGISNHNVSVIAIHLHFRGTFLEVLVRNSVHKNGTPPDSSGIGLENTKRRLDLLYPERYELVLNEKNNEFSVHLKIQLA